MALPGVTSLAELVQLNRSLLHMFVVGPGEGEGIALALPGSGWVLIDGCRATKLGNDDLYPLEEIVKRYRHEASEPVEAMVLTHPHRDHAHGFAELIEEFRPRIVGLTGKSVDSTILDAFTDHDARRRIPTGDAIKNGVVLGAMFAIQRWCFSDPPEIQLVPLHEDANLLNRGNLQIRARSPSLSFLETLTDDVPLKHANQVSTVLEILYGKTMVVLGADLPTTERGRKLASGWDLVMRNHRHLAFHDGLKVPHHGSREALHKDLVGPFKGKDRAWCVTPFNSSSLPRIDDDDGLDQLLKGQSPIMLTAMSLSRKLQAKVSASCVTPREMGEITRQLKRGPTFNSDDTLFRTARSQDPLDPVWCVAFDAEGGIQHRWRGATAVEVKAR